MREVRCEGRADFYNTSPVSGAGGSDRSDKGGKPPEQMQDKLPRKEVSNIRGRGALENGLREQPGFGPYLRRSLRFR